MPLSECDREARECAALDVAVARFKESYEFYRSHGFPWSVRWKSSLYALGWELDKQLAAPPPVACAEVLRERREQEFIRRDRREAAGHRLIPVGPDKSSGKVCSNCGALHPRRLPAVLRRPSTPLRHAARCATAERVSQTKIRAGQVVVAYCDTPVGGRRLCIGPEADGLPGHPIPIEIAKTQAQAREVVTAIKQLIEELPP